jgi:iron complex transport system ATP-binding protein
MSRLTCQALDVSIASVEVVTGLNLDVRQGEFWGLLGPNGIGKTTLLNCLAGLAPPRSGSVQLEGQDIAELPRKLLARHVGMLQQHTVYVFDSSVEQTALTGRHPHLGYWEREGAEDRRKARDALAAVDLSGFEARSVTRLSGGEARRLAFATLMVQEPEIMLLDEPTNHLDMRHQVRLMERVRSSVARGQCGALAALHDVNLAARYCSHVLMLFGAGQWCSGTVNEMLTEESLARLYGCPVEQLDSPHGPRFYPLSD